VSDIGVVGEPDRRRRMKTGPQIECQGCGLHVLLAFAECDGPRRVLTCPMCGHVHLWVVTDVRGSGGSDDWRFPLGSSVE
jgi:DNA-directed RNA polymerase subunit RPC12/RpoP